MTQAAPSLRDRAGTFGLSTEEFDLLVSQIGREPNALEAAIVGAMWSEHCGYKNSRPLFRHFPTTGPQVLQGPGENAGVVDIGDGWGVAFKMESHNHPSAVEPVPRPRTMPSSTRAAAASPSRRRRSWRSIVALTPGGRAPRRRLPDRPTRSGGHSQGRRAGLASDPSRVARRSPRQ